MVGTMFTKKTLVSLKNNYDFIYKNTSNCLINKNSVTKQNYSNFRNKCIKNQKLSIKNNEILSENIKIISNNKINSSSSNMGKKIIKINEFVIINILISMDSFNNDASLEC